jgi:hypothetical protein
LRQIELEDALTIRFATQSEDFDRGVEVGMIAAMMAAGVSRFERSVAADVVEPVRALAAKMSYRVTSFDLTGERARLVISCSSFRPALRIVSA